MIKLKSSVSELSLVGPVYKQKLEKLEIETVYDLIHHVPHRYIDFRKTAKINSLNPGDIITVKGEVRFIKNQYTKYGKKMQLAEVFDNTGSIMVVWFNQPYLIKNIKAGATISLAGEVGWFGRKLALVSPEYETVTTIHTGRLIPIYPETKGLSSKWLRGRIKNAFNLVENKLEEFLPETTLKTNNLVTFKRAVKKVHFPKTLDDAREGRKRLSFNELLFHQLKSLERKRIWEKQKAYLKLEILKKEVNELINSFPFKLTASQIRSIDEILADLSKTTPMNRLLEGDVGSGKTVVAAVSCFVSFLNGYQSVIMAPTQILAQQHFTTLSEVFKKYKLRISLVTSAGVKKDLGKTDVFVGTHALIHKRVDFDKVALVVIDEQHRFGVKQRAKLIKTVKNKNLLPHILTMTATPIPRTIALTAYGDLDLSTLDELPKGRKPIDTHIVPKSKREDAYRWMEGKIKKEKVQSFVICPLIEESEKELMTQVAAAETEYIKLKNIFPDLKIGLLHGKQKLKEKNKVLDNFKKRKIDILVSTPVVEVGIDITNATIMVIEAADRFGLAQLHQLRGRVGRGKKKSYCMLFTENPSKKVNIRLSALKREVSGFKLAEIDLKLRGPGEIFGVKQHGFPELKIASWQDLTLIKKARNVAQKAVLNPKRFKLLYKQISDPHIVPN